MTILVALLLLVQEGHAADLIEQLRSEKIEERAHAMGELRKLGKAAVPELEKAVGDPDFEVARRARELLLQLNQESCLSTLRRIESSAVKAKTMSARFKVKADGPNRNEAARFEFSGAFLLKDGNKAYVKSDIRTPSGRWGATFRSSDSGTSLCVWNPESGAEQCGPSSDDFRLTMVQTAARVGAMFAAQTWAYSKSNGGSVEDLFYLYDFKDGRDGEVPTLEYAAKFSGTEWANLPRQVRTKVWYDPTTFRLIKRTIVFTRDQDGLPVSPEISEELAFDRDIPDESLDPSRATRRPIY